MVRAPGRGLRRARLPALACAAALLGAACGRGPARADETLSLAWTLAPDPPAVGPSRLSLRLADERGRPLGGARLQVEAGMTHPGMPPVVASAAEEEAGRYRADLDFTMAGSWFILVTGEIPHRGAFSRRIDVPHVRGR